MLKARIITALILIPIFVSGVLFLDTTWFALLMAAVIALAAWEWAGIAGYQHHPGRVVYALLVLGVLAMLFGTRSGPLTACIMALALIWWCFALWLVLSFQRRKEGEFRLPLPATLLGFLVLVPPWLSLVVLHAHEPDGARLVLFLLVLIWTADIAAYFVGRRWGKNRLCSRVSPGKSWEGVFGALVAAAVMALIYVYYQQVRGIELFVFTAVCLLTVLASILGDLLESLMKRTSNLKDSGSILPGHGGVLDRIDSLTAALPVFISALWLLEKLA